jgi:hypothetical protein
VRDPDVSVIVHNPYVVSSGLSVAASDRSEIASNLCVASLD